MYDERHESELIMYDTIFLNPNTWDLDIDANRNIALASAPYAQAQTVANACRLWAGEAPFDNTRGIPYDQLLGQLPARQTVSNWYQREALSVPGIKSAQPVLQYTGRKLTGQIQCTLTDGTTINV